MCGVALACVSACNEANNLLPDTVLSGGLHQMPDDLNANTKNIIKLYKDGGFVGPSEEQFATYYNDLEQFEQYQGRMREAHSFVKRQCMHCIDPACVAACPFSALTKDHETGVVAWNAYQCIGCRYCEVACPFEVPKFEWQYFNPRIVKCQFCDHRLGEGQEPACTSVCPTGAVVYGKRDALLEEAKERIAASPGTYFEDRVYGESDGGGTQVMYLSHVPFTKIGLPDLGKVSLAWYGTWVHSIIYKWLLIPAALYACMVFIIRKRWHHHEEEARHEAKKTGLPQQI
ncbi:MAG: hydrogenase 2 operon protein HybA [Myxococcales bacterium]|nr:hydrogenase 2 operon protein HybA [Myxococcales bacterium]